MSAFNHISLDLSSDVFNICEPFFKKYCLNAFSYARIYPDGTRTELWSDPQALEHTFFKKKYIVGAYTPNYFSEEEKFAVLQLKVNGYPKILREKYTQQLLDQRECFNHDHSFILINRETNFCEYFIFYAPIEAYSILNFYINNLDILNNFTIQFKHVAVDLIKKSDCHRIPMPHCSLLTKNNKSTLLDKKYPIFTSGQLSNREQEIAVLLLNGKVAREVGDILHISKRTVESHIEHMKIKANCHKKSELIGYLYSNKASFFS